MADWMKFLQDEGTNTSATTVSAQSAASAVGGGAGSGDWSSFLFGNKEKAGAVGVGVQALGGVVQSWLGYENLKLGKQNFALQKQAFNENMKTANMEAALKLDARKRGLEMHGVSSDIVNKYAAKYQ